MFTNLPMSVFTIFRCLVGAECTTADGNPIFLLISSNFGWEYGLVYCCCSVFMTFGLFNVIVAIYVENTVAAAKFNDTHQKRQRVMDQHMFVVKVRRLVEFVVRLHRKLYGRDSLGSAVNEEDVWSFEITPEYFETLRSYKEFQEILRDLDVADEDQLDLFETLDVDGGGSVDLEELVAGIAKLRGDARRSDIIGMSLIIRSMQCTMQSFNDLTNAKLRQQTELLQAMHSSLGCTSGRSFNNPVLTASKGAASRSVTDSSGSLCLSSEMRAQMGLPVDPR